MTCCWLGDRLEFKVVFLLDPTKSRGFSLPKNFIHNLRGKCTDIYHFQDRSFEINVNNKSTDSNFCVIFFPALHGYMPFQWMRKKILLTKNKKKIPESHD